MSLLIEDLYAKALDKSMIEQLLDNIKSCTYDTRIYDDMNQRVWGSDEVYLYIRYINNASYEFTHIRVCGGYELVNRYIMRQRPLIGLLKYLLVMIDKCKDANELFHIYDSAHFHHIH